MYLFTQFKCYTWHREKKKASWYGSSRGCSVKIYFYLLLLLQYCLIVLVFLSLIKEELTGCPLIFQNMEKAMAPHSSTLAWKIPWTEVPGGLQFMGSLRVGHDWATSIWLFTFMHWRRKWQPTPVSLPRESQGQGSLVGCGLWGRTELNSTEVTQHFKI